MKREMVCEILFMCLMALVQGWEYRDGQIVDTGIKTRQVDIVVDEGVTVPVVIRRVNGEWKHAVVKFSDSDLEECETERYSGIIENEIQRLVEIEVANERKVLSAIRFWVKDLLVETHKTLIFKCLDGECEDDVIPHLQELYSNLVKTINTKKRDEIFKAYLPYRKYAMSLECIKEDSKLIIDGIETLWKYVETPRFLDDEDKLRVKVIAEKKRVKLENDEPKLQNLLL